MCVIATARGDHSVSVYTAFNKALSILVQQQYDHWTGVFFNPNQNDDY